MNVKEIEGHLHRAEGFRTAIIASRFNERVVKNLLDGALNTFKRYGVKEEHITLIWVPGAYEIPLVAKTVAQSKKHHALICLGAVIRGATPHFDFVAGQAAAGIQQATLESGIPIIFGVLTTDNVEQALERAGSKMGNKGSDAALAALEMADLMQQLKPEPSTVSQMFCS